MLIQFCKHICIVQLLDEREKQNYSDPTSKPPFTRMRSPSTIVYICIYVVCKERKILSQRWKQNL